MVPEISHRCPSCGASVREADALFCPECGKPLSKSAQHSAPAEADKAASSASDSGDVNVQEESKQQSEQKATASDTIAKGGAQDSAPATAGHPHGIADKTRETLHRASAAARGVIEDEVKRVERIRLVSTTVIEEASYDASLRFVLVALGLFIVFVILLVLSKVMG